MNGSLTPREADRVHGCTCSWEDDYLIDRLRMACPVGEHRLAFWDQWRSRWWHRAVTVQAGLRRLRDGLR